MKPFLLSDFLRLLTLFLVVLFVLAMLVRAVRADDRAEQRSLIYPEGATGRVGIGTTAPLVSLDVSEGEIKIGSTGASCADSLAGTLRYSEKKLQFCDGAGWRNVSLDKAE